MTQPRQSRRAAIQSSGVGRRRRRTTRNVPASTRIATGTRRLSRPTPIGEIQLRLAEVVPMSRHCRRDVRLDRELTGLIVSEAVPIGPATLNVTVRARRAHRRRRAGRIDQAHADGEENKSPARPSTAVRNSSLTPCVTSVETMFGFADAMSCAAAGRAMPLMLSVKKCPLRSRAWLREGASFISRRKPVQWSLQPKAANVKAHQPAW